MLNLLFVWTAEWSDKAESSEVESCSWQMGWTGQHYQEHHCTCAIFSLCCLVFFVPSVLWRCWLGGRKDIRPVKKTEQWGAGMVICLEWGAGLHMVQLMPLPLTVSCFEIQIGFSFLVPAHPGSPGKVAVKRVLLLHMMPFCRTAPLCSTQHKTLNL